MKKIKSINDLKKISPLYSWFIIAFDWLGISLVFYMMIKFPHIITYIIGAIFIARFQIALFVLMHDATHHRLFKSKILNDLVGQIFLGSPVFFSLESYRFLHLKHHQKILSKEDPDLSLTGGYPIKTKSFLRKLGRDLLGVSYFKFFKYFLFFKPVHTDQQNPFQKVTYKVFVISLIVNSIIFTTLYLSGNPWLYLVWPISFITIAQVFLRIRGIAEHAGYTYQKDQMQISRTVINPLQTFFLAPHNVNYHIEHHQYPQVPWYRLKKLHRLMIQDKSYPRKNLYANYGDIVKEIII